MPPASLMGQVTVTLNGRTYSLQCADGEEARLIQLAGLVKHRAEALVEEFGQVGDDCVLLLTAIMIADELLPAQPAAASGAALSLPPEGVAWSQVRSQGRKSAR
jgi:cell division protein ZapA